MKLKGYLISHETEKGITNIINRIKEMGGDMYSYYKCIPELLIWCSKDNEIFIKDKTYIYFNCDHMNMEYMNLLGFSFEGLFDSEDKINEIESFGRYGCIIEKVNTTINKKNFIIKDFEF
jgi:hypothetical protein